MTEPLIRLTHGMFSLACSVTVYVHAATARVWTLLTDAGNFGRWNSTVTRIEGEIQDGAKLRIHAPGTNRTFNPRVSGVVACERMTWTGGFLPLFRGVRTFELKPREDGSTDFGMAERFSGLLLPIVRRSLPNFGPIFSQFATDLKRAAER